MNIDGKTSNTKTDFGHTGQTDRDRRANTSGLLSPSFAVVADNGSGGGRGERRGKELGPGSRGGLREWLAANKEGGEGLLRAPCLPIIAGECPMNHVSHLFINHVTWAAMSNDRRPPPTHTHTYAGSILVSLSAFPSSLRSFIELPCRSSWSPRPPLLGLQSLECLPGAPCLSSVIPLPLMSLPLLVSCGL